MTTTLTESDFKSIHDIPDRLPNGKIATGFANKYDMELYVTKLDSYPSLHQIPTAGGVGFKDQNRLASLSGASSKIKIETSSCVYRSKIYIPPGTTSIYFNALITTPLLVVESDYWFTAKLGSAPTGALDDAPGGGGERGVPRATNGFTLEAVRTDERKGWRTTHQEIIFLNDSGILVTEGDWFYLNIPTNQEYIGPLVAVITVDTAVYKEWFKTARWGKNGDPIQLKHLPKVVATQEYTYSPYASYLPMHIKAFIPPGCTYFSLIGLRSTAAMVAVYRFGSYIDTDYTEYIAGLDNATLTQISKLPQVKTLTSILDTSYMCAGIRNRITLPNIWDYSKTSETADITGIPENGGWVYVSLYLLSGINSGITIKYGLNADRYLRWYSMTLWDKYFGHPYLGDDGDNPGEGTIDLDTPRIIFNSVTPNSVAYAYIELTNTYGIPVHVRITSSSQYVTFTNGGNISIGVGESVSVECIYTAKVVGIFSVPYYMEVLGTTKREMGILSYTCIEPTDPSLVVYEEDSNIIVFSTIKPGESSTASMEVINSYLTDCTLRLTDIPAEITPISNSIVLEADEYASFELTFEYTSNSNLDSIMYITSDEYDAVSIPVYVYGVCTNKIDTLIIVQDSFDFGATTLGTATSRYLVLCNKYSKDLVLNTICNSLDINISESHITLSPNETKLIKLEYIPKVDGTILTDININLTWLDYTKIIPVTGNCPVYVPEGEPTFLMVNAPDYRRAELGEHVTGTVAIINNRGTGSIASMSYPEGFSGTTEPFTVEFGTPREIEVTFIPTEYKEYSGTIKVLEIDK